MIWNTVEIFTNFVEAFLISRFVIKYFRCKSGINIIIAYIFMFVPLGILITIINNITIYEGIYILAYILYLMIASNILCKGNFLNKMFISFFIVVLIIIINTFVLTIFSNLFNESIYNLIISEYPLRLSILFITKFLFFLVTQIILSNKKEETSLSTIEWLLIMVIFIVSLILATTIFKFMLLSEVKNNSFLELSIIEIMFVDIVSYYLITVISKKNQEHQISSMTKLQLEHQKDLIEETKKNFKEMSKIRHDTKNYLLCIEELLKNGNVEKAIEYIQTLNLEKLTNTHKYVDVQNDVVNAILNSKFSKCHDSNIDIDYNITGDFSSISDIDISILLCNLLDNSIEACLKCTLSPKIFMEIYEEKGYLHIMVKNTVDKSILKSNPYLRTTKNNNEYHGFGILSIKDIVQKYDGLMDFYEKDLLFICHILLKIRT